MAIKLHRFYVRDSYAVNEQLLNELKVSVIPPNKCFIGAMTSDHGIGRIEGTTKKMGENYSPVTVCVFRRDNKLLLWETESKDDGTYAFRNIAKGLECFVVAFDPNEQFNAVISDKLVAK